MELSTLASVFSIAGAASNLFGASEGMSGARESGLREAQAREFQAAQLEQRAGQEQASAQRGALEQHRLASLVSSRALAVAAASGGGVSDPTIVNLLSMIAGEGAYRAGVSIYEGEEKARNLRMSAAAARMGAASAIEEGELRAGSYALGGFGSFATSAGSLFAKYAGRSRGPSGGHGDAALLGGFDPDVYNLNTYG